MSCVQMFPEDILFIVVLVLSMILTTVLQSKQYQRIVEKNIVDCAEDFIFSAYASQAKGYLLPIHSKIDHKKLTKKLSYLGNSDVVIYLITYQDEDNSFLAIDLAKWF